MPRVIGLLFGREETFPPALIQEVNSRNLSDVRAEPVRLGAISADEPCPYRVLIDRISHMVPFYREVLRNAAVNSGTYVINNPLWADTDDRFLQAGLARALGLNVPRTVVLPSRSYASSITGEYLQNLEYPLRWEEILESVGRPAILKPARGWSRTHEAIHSVEDLLAAYNRSGERVMTLQEWVPRDAYVRCLGVGDLWFCRPFDPRAESYLPEQLTPSVQVAVIQAARRLSSALGYEVSVVEFAVRDGQPWLLDRAYPVPDFDWWSLSEPYFQQVVGAVADLAVARARSDEPTPLAPPFAGGRREPTPTTVAR
ncbi:MAG: hypothetical protein AB1758_15820 [Candidatus Eremiobacterota bacterium]